MPSLSRMIILKKVDFVKKLILLLVLMFQVVYANDNNSTITDTSEFSKEEKAVMLNSAVGLGIITWGVLHWDYSIDNDMHTESEGWFQHDTDEGGSDKFGHMYISYGLTHLFSYFYKEIGYEGDDVPLYGAFSSLFLTGLMEVGDSFSDYGFSYEDMTANVLGTFLGYVTYKYPSIGRKIDYRTEYKIDKSELSGDFVTDYENMKYLLAFKADGFDIFEDYEYLKYLELYVGYYSRGYAKIGAKKERNTFVGFGINLSKVFDTKIFKYYQVPDIYLRNR
ncbi:DUF2279 domain-containing protein [Sulfurimonas sp.]|uniref:DUF2279 domain-containing protein n=1 Tax=Sulfurimonas sp. TaxID=2022749 RepID=UPI003567CA8A